MEGAILMKSEDVRKQRLLIIAGSLFIHQHN